MKINDEIISLLNILAQIDTVKKTLRKTNDTVKISGLVEINKTSLKVGGIDFEEKILLNGTALPAISELKNFEKFVKRISVNIIRLNHLGISYGCDDINLEIDRLKQLKLYEEDSGDKYNRWFFVGDKTNWENTLFELVLNQGPRQYLDDWIPHFQIDIDTNLDYPDLRLITDKIFGKEFIKWSLDVPNQGVVLCMGKIGQIEGTKIYLGIGTKARNTKSHRERLLEEI